MKAGATHNWLIIIHNMRIIVCHWVDIVALPPPPTNNKPGLLILFCHPWVGGAVPLYLCICICVLSICICICQTQVNKQTNNPRTFDSLLPTLGWRVRRPNDCDDRTDHLVDCRAKKPPFLERSV